MPHAHPVRSVVVPLARIGAACSLVALAGVAMPGCIFVKSERVLLHEPRVPDTRLDQITLNTTTEAEVREILGQPASRESLADDRQRWIYRGISPNARGTIVVVEDGEAIRTTNASRGRVEIELTGGVVTAVRRD